MDTKLLYKSSSKCSNVRIARRLSRGESSMRESLRSSGASAGNTLSSVSCKLSSASRFCTLREKSNLIAKRTRSVHCVFSLQLRSSNDNNSSTTANSNRNCICHLDTHTNTRTYNFGGHNPRAVQHLHTQQAASSERKRERRVVSLSESQITRAKRLST